LQIALSSTGTAAVLEGQDSKTYKMVIDTADWHSACVTQNCTALAQILTVLTYCCGNSAWLHSVTGL